MGLFNHDNSANGPCLGCDTVPVDAVEVLPGKQLNATASLYWTYSCDSGAPCCKIIIA